MTNNRERDAALVRLWLAANDPALLRLLDKCRQAFDARMRRYWCPLITVSFADHLGRPVKAAWRGAQFAGFVNDKTWRRRSYGSR